MKLSVIVPVYNVEKFLPRYLDSLLRQGLYAGEYEVIFVNNGSPDNCATILAEYEARYPDVFKVITQENKGLGCARNTGMKVASGEWITFVDSDDYLMVGAYKYLLEHFCKGNVDVVAYGYHCVYTDGVERPYAGGSLAGHIVYEEDGAEYYNNKDELPYVWSKLYRRMFLQENDISFRSIYLEDTLFVFSYLVTTPDFYIQTIRHMGMKKIMQPHKCISRRRELFSSS